jgi:hypothetical protein
MTSHGTRNSLIEVMVDFVGGSLQHDDDVACRVLQLFRGKFPSIQTRHLSADLYCYLALLLCFNGSDLTRLVAIINIKSKPFFRFEISLLYGLLLLFVIIFIFSSLASQPASQIDRSD